MNAVSVADAKLNLEKLLESVVANVEPLIIVGDRGDQTVVVSLQQLQLLAGNDVPAGKSG